MWASIVDAAVSYDAWVKCELNAIDITDIEKSSERIVNELSQYTVGNGSLESANARMNWIKSNLSLIGSLGNALMTQKDWSSISEIMGFNVDDLFSLETLIEQGLDHHAASLLEILGPPIDH